MYICDNPSCKVWLHKECLIDDVLTKTYNKLVSGGETISTNGVAKPNGKKSKVKPYKGILSATIKEEGDAPPRAVITDLRPNADPRSWSESIVCVKCGVPIKL
jgi:hypothetical protein